MATKHEPKQLIKLTSRTGDNNYLELIEKKNEFAKFKLLLDKRFEDFCWFTYEKDVDVEEIKNATYCTLHAVDPSGGPYMAIGWEYNTKSEKGVLDKIEWFKGEGIYLTFKVSKQREKNETNLERL